jgi:hypothetical protein
MISRDFVLCFPMLSLSYFVLFCFVLFCFVLFCFVSLFCLFRHVLFCSFCFNIDSSYFYLFKTFKNEYKRK